MRSRPAVAGPSGTRRARRAGFTTALTGLMVVTVVGLRPDLALGDDESARTPLDIPAEATAEAAADGSADVIVRLAGADSASADPADVADQGEALLADLDEAAPAAASADAGAGDGDQVLEHLGVVSLEASPAQLDQLARSELVERIEDDAWLDASLDRSAALVGAPAAWAAGYTGTGSVVAVIDSGIDASHPALAGKVVHEACFTQGSCPGGLSSASGPGTAAPCTIGGPCQHGTHIAGIVAGTDPIYRGIAPDAGLMALQVFSRSDEPTECGGGVVPCPRARTSDVLEALDYVYAQRANLPIVAVNMSLSSDSASSPCDSSILAGAVGRLKSVGVATVVATGNAGATDGLGLPACITDTVSVAASYADRDQLWEGSNVSPQLDLVAPGVGIVSPAPGGGFSGTTGTSAAAPHVAGAWALAVQRLGTTDVDTILQYLVANGRPLDAAGMSKPRLDLNALAGGTSPAAGFVAVDTTANPCASCIGVSGDFDGDGRDDLFWHEQNGTSRLWTSLGDGRYREDLAIAIGPTPFVPVAGDFDGDGLADLLWYPSGGGDTWLWQSLGGGSFSSSRAFVTGPGWQPLAGDFDGNGIDDVFFYGPGDQPSTMFRAQPGGQFAADPAWAIGGSFLPVAGDFDGNGVADLFWQGLGTVGDWLSLADGTGQFVGYQAPAVDGDVVPAVGDFNGDGRSDILWVAPGGSTSVLWRTSGAWDYQAEQLSLGGDGRDVTVTGDFNGDGRADIYWYGADSRPDRLWLAA